MTKKEIKVLITETKKRIKSTSDEYIELLEDMKKTSKGDKKYDELEARLEFAYRTYNTNKLFLEVLENSNLFKKGK